MKTITKVIVGSKLHGLDTPKSDTDIRGVFMSPLKDLISPFTKPKETSWIEGNVDNTSYELRRFCKDATRGNATILEIFFSNQILQDSPIAQEMRANWQKFMDTDKFVLASRGYASNQYNKMQLFDPDQRTPKFAVAYVRVLWQCAEFLRTDIFPCQITEPQIKQFLMKVKNNFSSSYIPALTQMFMEMQQRVTDAYANPLLKKYEPDYPWIEDFLLRSYTNA